MISLIPTKISGGANTNTKNNKSFYMQYYNQQEKDGLELNWAQ